MTVLALEDKMALGELVSKRGRGKECQGHCGEGVLLGEHFIWPAKGSACASRMEDGEGMVGLYAF
jgi:hypothetical protein